MFPGTENRLGYSGMCEDQSVCRDYLRNVCKRGKKCKFKHPSLEECERLRRFDKTFCHDFQNSTCRRPNCKFLHYTKEEEEIFRRTGYLPNDSQWSYRPALNTSDEKTPICKDFCNGACNRGSNCKYRHVTLSQEAINHGLFNQHSLQEAGFTNTNMSSVRFDPSIMKISNPTVASHFGQSSLINRAVIVSPNNSILNPVSNSYIPVASSHSIVGLIGNTSTGQPTLYTHSPLVSLTSAPHITPCSSVITVSPDPLQNPNILHPQTALPAPHTTYHIVPHDASHHHLLATSSSHSHAPTLLTIPLSQFTCNVSNNSLIQSQAAITCSTQHHAVVTGVLPTDSSISTAPGTYFPSYSVFHINQPSLETHDHHLQQQITTETQKQIHKTEISPCSTTVITPVTATSTTTTSVASSTTAVLAAAAAAGYIARHLPVIGPSNCCAVIPNVQIKSNELDTELNLFNTIANISAGNNSSTDSCSCQDSSQVSCMKHDNIDPTKTIATNTVTTSFIQSYSTLESSNTSDDNNNSTSNNSNNSIKLISPTDPGSMPCSGSSSSDYLNPTDEEQAKTAAAVAAAACIGAIFSQPMAAAAAAASSSSGGGGNSASSSVAAMLGSLISRNSQDIIQAVQSSSSSSPCGPSLLFNSSRHICSSSGKSTSGRDVESSVGHHSLQQHQQYFAVDERNIVNELNERGNCVNLVNKSVDQHNSTIQSNVVNTSSSSASLVSSSDRCKCTNSSLDSSYSFQNIQILGPELHPPCHLHVLHHHLRVPTALCVVLINLGINHPGKLEKQNTYRTTTGNSRLPKNSECDYHRTCSSSSSHNDFASPSSYETDNHIYSLTHDESNRYPAKRHKTKRLRSVDCRYSGCSSLHHHTDLTRSSVDDYEDDDPDVYEDDDIESTALMSPSPEVTPPYNPPAKLSKRKGLLSLSYSRQVEDSRPASCETSPDPWVSTSHKIVMSRTTNKSDCLENHPSQSLSTLQFSNYQSSEHGKGSFCVANSTPHPELLSTNSTGSYYYYPIRRSLSTGVLPLKTSCKIIPKKRSKSFPVLNSFHSHLKEEKQVFLVSSNSSRRHNITESFSIRPAMSGTSTSLCCSKDGSMNKFLSSRYRNRIFVRKRFRRITHRYSAQHPNNRRFLMRNTRPLSNVSPTSILSEEYSGRDEGDDPDFVDPDYDDDLYELPVPQTSSKRSPHGIPKYSTKRKRSVYSSTSNLHIAPPSIKQQYALRIENARLRRKLIDLMRQRGDLRAANEMLLEQNARLRQSSKRVSAVARMAESATKIIEAHNKSQLAQSSGFSSSSGGASQSTVPFSIAQAAAVVVAAAAQNQTNAPNLTGVYVSSPTASINQQHSPTINTLGGVSGGNSSLHTLFPQIPPANATGIAIPSNQALTAVQIQAPPGALAAPPPQATALIHHQQTLDPQQSGISNYYQHQMNRPLETASIANASVSPTIQNISQPSSTFQVCHYPVVSIASVFPKLSQDVSAENPKLVSVGAPNTVTLLLGQSTPQTPTYAIPASVSSHPNVPLQIPVTVGTHLTPAVSCPPHHGPTKLVVSVAYPNQAAAVANVMPTTSTHYVSPNPVNNQTSVLPNQIQIVHKLTTTHHSACTK
ncbi:Zinc finger CCCH domain-containing protein 10 [Schistosoma japonicum]|nr:Zinc finger CCCH domain-containing protein 10 [Schistosoma japonicum]